MKILFKTLIASLTFIALFFNNNARAQTTPAGKLNLSFGLETGLPTRDVKNEVIFTLGATAQLQYGLTDKLAATFTIGAYLFAPKISPYNGYREPGFGLIPVKAGLKYFILQNIYVAGEAGIGREVTKAGFAGGQTKFLWTPGIGYANKRWDFGIRYESLTSNYVNYGLVSARVAYGFGL